MWKNHHCPKCGRLLYSRAQRQCGWCRAPLPDEFLMSEDAVDAMKDEILAIQKRREAAKILEEKEALWRGQ